MTDAAPHQSVKTKAQMYAMIQAGVFGNIVPLWFNLNDWEQSPEFHRYEFWGVRSQVPGGPCFLNCPRAEVRATFLRPDFQAAVPNISIMIDRILRVHLWADVYDSEQGLVLYGIEYPPPGGSWRQLMGPQGRQYGLLESRLLLRKHLNASSLSDLEALRDLYPGHVYELSVCDRNFGTIPGRNAVLWECRCATGEYERGSWGNY